MPAGPRVKLSTIFLTTAMLLWNPLNIAGVAGAETFSLEPILDPQFEEVSGWTMILGYGEGAVLRVTQEGTLNGNGSRPAVLAVFLYDHGGSNVDYAWFAGGGGRIGLSTDSDHSEDLSLDAYPHRQSPVWMKQSYKLYDRELSQPIDGYYSLFIGAAGGWKSWNFTLETVSGTFEILNATSGEEAKYLEARDFNGTVRAEVEAPTFVRPELASRQSYTIQAQGILLGWFEGAPEQNLTAKRSNESVVACSCDFFNSIGVDSWGPGDFTFNYEGHRLGGGSVRLALFDVTVPGPQGASAAGAETQAS